MDRRLHLDRPLLEGRLEPLKGRHIQIQRAFTSTTITTYRLHGFQCHRGVFLLHSDDVLPNELVLESWEKKRNSHLDALELDPQLFDLLLRIIFTFLQHCLATNEHTHALHSPTPFLTCFCWSICCSKTTNRLSRGSNFDLTSIAGRDVGQ